MHILVHIPLGKGHFCRVDSQNVGIRTHPYSRIQTNRNNSSFADLKLYIRNDNTVTHSPTVHMAFLWNFGLLVKPSPNGMPRNGASECVCLSLRPSFCRFNLEFEIISHMYSLSRINLAIFNHLWSY